MGAMIQKQMTSDTAVFASDHHYECERSQDIVIVKDLKNLQE